MPPLGGKPGMQEICRERGITHRGMSASSPNSHRTARQGEAWTCQQLKWGGGMGQHPLPAPQSCPCPDVVLCGADHGALGCSPVLGPQLGIPILPRSPCWHGYQSVPCSPGILPFFFFAATVWTYLVHLLPITVHSLVILIKCWQDSLWLSAILRYRQAYSVGERAVQFNFGFVGYRLEVVLLVRCALISVRQQHDMIMDS